MCLIDQYALHASQALLSMTLRGGGSSMSDHMSDVGCETCELLQMCSAHEWSTCSGANSACFWLVGALRLRH
jgi:hypothetical protein